jgi:serine/threonine protein kinase
MKPTVHDRARRATISLLVSEIQIDEHRAGLPGVGIYRRPTGPLPADETLRLAIQIASAMDAAHQRGIIHRDLKLANILLTSGRRSGGASSPPLAKILDFHPISDCARPCSLSSTAW